MDSPKEILDSKYILLSKIGSGGTAEVASACHHNRRGAQDQAY